MAPTFTCMIIDDETKAIVLLKELLKRWFGNVVVVGELGSEGEAIEALKHIYCDLLLLDIAMPLADGFSLLYALPELKAALIFVTAHPEYALHALHFGATGYILKPVNEEELILAVQKALERILARRMN